MSKQWINYLFKAFVVVLSLTLVPAFTGITPPDNAWAGKVKETICNDGIDNDGDGKIDCADNDCRNDVACIGEPENTAALCSDTIDNDLDGLTDCADPDCAAFCGEPENTAALCSDTIDNDLDGLTDCADPDCAAFCGSHSGLSWNDYPANCNGCHAAETNDIYNSVHYQWIGDTPDMLNQKGTPQGKIDQAVNSYCINILGDWPVCGTCHVGRGLRPDDPQAGVDNVDCLMCHNEDYAMARTRLADGSMGPPAGTPQATLDGYVQNVKRPTRRNCLKCHANAGGGDGVKRGDLSMATIDNSDPNFDVHMNTTGMNLVCQDCHTFVAHKVTGKGSDLRPTDYASEVSCVTCHTGMDSGSGHASKGRRTEPDRHVARVRCQSCHIPTYAKVATETNRDWRTKHDGTDASTCSDTNPCPGHPHTESAANLVPKYRFWNRMSDNLLLYDVSSPAPDTGLYPTSRPGGDITDGKLTPFKYKMAVQPIADSTSQLIALDTFVYLKGNGNVDDAIQSGMANMGISGSYSWVTTDTFQMINHGVNPAASAADCTQCHPTGNLDLTTDSMLDAMGYRLKDDPSLICSQCHREKRPKDHESMHNHINKGSGIGCYFCHDVARPERGLCDPCDPACVAEFVDTNPYPHQCPAPPY